MQVGLVYDYLKVEYTGIDLVFGQLKEENTGIVLVFGQLEEEYTATGKFSIQLAKGVYIQVQVQLMVS